MRTYTMITDKENIDSCEFYPAIARTVCVSTAFKITKNIIFKPKINSY